MVAPPDNDVLWARALRCSSRGAPVLDGVSLDVRGGEILAVLGPRGSGKTDAAALPVRTARARRGRGVVRQRPRAHPARRGPRAAAPGPVRLDRLRPRAAARAERVGERRAAPAAARRRAARRRAPPPGSGWSGWTSATSPACAPPACTRRSASASPWPGPWPAGPPWSSPTSRPRRCTADRAQVLRTLTSAARSHGITVVLATSDPGDRPVRRPHGRPGGRQARRRLPRADPRPGRPAAGDRMSARAARAAAGPRTAVAGC